MAGPGPPLYLVSGQCAILNQCLSQGDSFFKSAIKSIPDVPDKVVINNEESPSEEFLVYENKQKTSTSSSTIRF